MLILETGFIIFILFALGTAIGSFLHVVAERNMSGDGIVQGGSICPYCKKRLTPRELIPIVSYLLQRGRCRSCGVHIPMHYLIIELLTGFFCVAVLASAVFASAPLVVPILTFAVACILLILIHIDARSMMLPDKFIFIFGILATCIAVLSGKTGDDMAFGMLVGSGLIYVIWLATAGQGIGFGDVKLMIPLGILFGVQGTITLLFIAFFVGGLVGIVLLATKLATRKTAIPFGPFIAGAALLVLIFPQLPDRFFALLGV